MRMRDSHTLARARKFFEQHTWADSCRLFGEADREVPLEPEDLERLATAAYLMGAGGRQRGVLGTSTSRFPRSRRPRRHRAVRLQARCGTAAARRGRAR